MISVVGFKSHTGITLVEELENQLCDDSNASRALVSTDLAGLAEDMISATTHLYWCCMTLSQSTEYDVLQRNRNKHVRKVLIF